MNEGKTMRHFHEVTSNTARRRWARPSRPPGFVPMDPGNKPAAFRRYPGTALHVLPTDLAPEGASAVAVLSGRADPEPARVDLRLLARLLFFSGGVTRVLQHGGARTYFRAAASAGNLHPLESYLVCGALGGLDAGVYHFAPDAFALERLRIGEHRRYLADAAADPNVAATPAALVITGIPWRTAWKYAERGWRHLYWDAGSMLANLLALAEAYGVDVRLLFGFRDAALNQLLGLDGVTEFPLLMVALGSAASSSPANAAAEQPQPLQAKATPLSPAPIEFPLITAAQHAGKPPRTGACAVFESLILDPLSSRRWRGEGRAVGQEVGQGGRTTRAPADWRTRRRNSHAPTDVSSPGRLRGVQTLRPF